MSDSHLDGALFQSAHSALVFAFNYSRQQYERPLMNRLASSSSGTGKGLVGLDGAGQAGFIRAEVARLGQNMEAILIARVAPRWMPCSCRAACCSGKTFNQEWMDAVSILADMLRATALSGCSSGNLLCRNYVVRYVTPKDSRQSFEEIAASREVNRQTVSTQYSKAAKTLQQVEDAAQAIIDDRLRNIGIVGE